MVKICYMLVAFCEMAVGIAIINKVYPKFRFENRAMKVLAIFLFCMSGFVYVWNSCLFYISTSFSIVACVVLTVLYFLFWHSNFLNILLLQLFYYINIAILKIPILTIRGIRCHENVILVNQGARTLEEAAWSLLILVLICVLLKRCKNAEIILRKMLENKLLSTLLIIIMWWLLCYCMQLGKVKFQTSDFILNMIIILCVSMVMLAIAIFETYQQIKRENLLQEETYAHLKSQYCRLKELYEENSRWVHDSKHELLYIGSCLEENNVSGAYESIQGYLQKIRRTEKKVWSSFPFLDFMLNYKKKEMDQQNINFMLDIELHHIAIPEEDLVIIIGNLLDNAVEAASKCEKSRRYIKLKIHNLNKMLLLCIENSSKEMPKLKNDTIVSSKKDKGTHGWGIESVKRLVETNNGEIHFQYTEKHFQVQIMI